MALDFKSFDFRSVQKLLDPKASGDLNAFLEKLPQNAGQTVLIAAGIAWAMAGALGLYASIQAKQLTELRAELLESEARKPIVPTIKDVPIDKKEVEAFIKKVSPSYKGLTFKVNGSTIVITSQQTSNFAMFREAIGHMQNGGSGWRVGLEKLCVGRECGKSEKLAVSLKVNKVSVENPTIGGMTGK
ncbi:MAG: hypothetical protein DI551_03170 [Micavibrio aeruginosavorus]|uniref:Uncharacterized protein n=1 Tax=Micavibrio aeruginosavorus TaxID=349221 RepID=A0A2W5N1Y6_9BACT|nr:MAG: hypothetical protein DI551_03170 [Micavibrio aeruginosavorus]